MTEFRDTLEILSRLRKVKYGDVVLSSDHNDLVDSVNALFDLILPSRINPYDFVYDPYYVFNFFEPNPLRIYTGEYQALQYNTIKPSIAVASKPNTGVDIELVNTSTPHVAVCLRYVKREKRDTYPYDFPYFFIGLVRFNISNGSIETFIDIGYVYNDQVDAIIDFTDWDNPKTLVSPIPTDWHVIYLDVLSGDLYIYDRNHNVIGRSKAYIDTNNNIFTNLWVWSSGEEPIYPNAMEVDWIAF